MISLLMSLERALQTLTQFYASKMATWNYYSILFLIYENIKKIQGTSNSTPPPITVYLAQRLII